MHVHDPRFVEKPPPSLEQAHPSFFVSQIHTSIMSYNFVFEFCRVTPLGPMLFTLGPSFTVASDRLSSIQRKVHQYKTPILFCCCTLYLGVGFFFLPFVGSRRSTTIELESLPKIPDYSTKKMKSRSPFLSIIFAFAQIFVC